MNTPRNISSLGDMPLIVIVAALALLLLYGCSDSSDSTTLAAPITNAPLLSGCADSDSCPSNPPLTIGGARAASVHIPSDYDPNTRYPLLMVLHGFGADGSIQSAYLGFTQRVDAKQYILVTPDGTPNAASRRFWNATPACCAFSEDDRSVDDIAYLRGLIKEAASTYSIDTSRVALYGHSNGGFMALRLACEASDLVTTVISLAGSTWESAESCAPATYPVSVMALHGTRDDTIPYQGVSGSYPGAAETAARFAALAGCNSQSPLRLLNVDMDGSVAGSETERLQYTECSGGASVALWTINGGAHIPAPWTDDAYELTSNWLIEHPRTGANSSPKRSP